MSAILEILKRQDYRIGCGQAIIYNPKKLPQLFPDGYLGDLYFKLKGSRFTGRQPNEDSILETLFCGMPNVSYDAIVPYLATRLPLVMVGVWESGRFHEAGFGFPTNLCGMPLGYGDERACFFGYGFFKDWWGKPEMEPLAMLGLALIFQELNCLAIHGMRYDSNDLTAKFSRRFGFRDVAHVSHYMLRRGKLVGTTVSTLLRTDFEAYVERVLLQEFADGQGFGESVTRDSEGDAVESVGAGEHRGGAGEERTGTLF